MSQTTRVLPTFVIRQRGNGRFRLFKTVDHRQTKYEVVRREDDTIIEFNSTSEALIYCRAKFKAVPQII